jgi:hypothetical protein
MQHVTAPVLPIHILCWVVSLPVITVSIAVLLIFLANAVIFLVSFSVNFTTRREEHTLSGVEVGQIRIPADDRKESNSNTPEFLV